MLNYVLRRCFYSLWVIFGVLILTFVLFNMSAGDPAAAVLGKNALPEEIENFRQALGNDLPLFYGKLCKTEAFNTWNGTSGSVTIKRNFKRSSITAKVSCKSGKKFFVDIDDQAQNANFSAPANSI